MSTICMWDPRVPGAPDAWEVTLNGPHLPRAGDHLIAESGAIAEVSYVLFDFEGDVVLYLALCNCLTPQRFSASDHEAWFAEDH